MAYAIATYADVLAIGQTLLDDSAAAVVTSGVFLPYANMGYRHVQRELANRAVGTLTDRTTKDLAANVTSITTATSPALPVDLLVPLELSEKVQGAGDETYVPMNYQDDLPIRVAGAQMGDWTWEAGQLRFLGCTQAVTLSIKYQKALPNFTTGTDSVVIANCEDAVAHAGAMFYARIKGDHSSADRWERLLPTLISSLANQYVRGNSRKGRRRRAYGRMF